jgi:signal transduction histidine kinase
MPTQVDALRMEQVLSNVLENAVKYSEDDGTVEVCVGVKDGGILLAVRDEGIGLPPGAECAIFDPFARGDNAIEREGMGLGLYICRQIVHRHGGRIWGSSPGPDKGTTFSVWIPFAGVTE